MSLLSLRSSKENSEERDNDDDCSPRVVVEMLMVGGVASEDRRARPTAD